MLDELTECHNVIVTYQPHNAYCMSISDYVIEEKRRGFSMSFLEGDLEKCIETNTLWEFHMFPFTASGSYLFYGPTYESVLAQAKEVYAGAKKRWNEMEERTKR